MNRSSQSAPSSVPAEVARHLLGLCSFAQLADALILGDSLPIDGVLKQFERRVEMLHPRPKPLTRFVQPASGHCPVGSEVAVIGQNRYPLE